MNKTEKHIFSDSYNERKARLLSHLDEKEGTNEQRISGRRSRSAMLIAAVLAAVLAVSVGAAVALSRINMTKTGGKTTVTASLGDTETEEKPVRAWNPKDGEVAVRLDFAYLPDDMTEDETAQYKFGSVENGRWMTLYGYDLRQKEMNSIITDTTDAEEFTAGGHQTYLVRTSETHSDNYLYVMFEEDDLVVGGYIGKGITDEELKKIVEGMTLTETTDVYTAVPIREKDDGQAEWSFPAFHTEDVLKSVGDAVKDADGRFMMTVNKINVLDSFEGIDMADCRKDQIEPFVDEDGRMKEYQRTEVIWEDGIDAISHFGETKTVKKCLVTAEFTYTNTTGEKEPVWVLDSRIFGDGKDYRIGETRKQAHFSEPIYVSDSSKTGEDSPYIREIDAGETISFTLGWLIDEDLSESGASIEIGENTPLAIYEIND